MYSFELKLLRPPLRFHPAAIHNFPRMHKRISSAGNARRQANGSCGTRCQLTMIIYYIKPNHSMKKTKLMTEGPVRGLSVSFSSRLSHVFGSKMSLYSTTGTFVKFCCTPHFPDIYYQNEVLFCASTCSISGGHSEVSQQHLCISSINTHAHSSIHLRIIIRSIIPSSSHTRLSVHQVTVRLMTQAALYQNRLRMRVANIVARVCRVAHAHNFRCQPVRDESASLNVTPALHCISAQSHIPKAHKSKRA